MRCLTKIILFFTMSKYSTLSLYSFRNDWVSNCCVNMIDRRLTGISLDGQSILFCNHAYSNPKFIHLLALPRIIKTVLT